MVDDPDGAVPKMIGLVISAMSDDLLPCGTCTVDVSASVVLPSVKARIFWGFYEQYELQFIRRYIGDDLDIIELGASLGVTTSHLAQILPLSRALICVEADPRLIEIIATNVQRNAPWRPITIVHAAVDYSGSDRVQFSLNANNAWSKLGRIEG
jgi:hypothetical protein